MSTKSEPFLSIPELHQWLSDEDWYPSAHTKEWLKRTPRDEATTVLAHLAEQADLEPRHPWAVLVMVGVMGGFVPSQGAVGGKVLDRKVGIRAAMYLAEFGDVRAIVPLCRLWTSSPIKKSKYHDQIEAALTTLLVQHDGEATPTETKNAVRNLVPRVWAAAAPNRDLSPEQADLLIAAIHFLDGIRDALAVIHATPSRLPRRARVQEAAQSAANSVV